MRWWAHFEFTHNITPTILRKKIEELRIVGALSAINGENQQERSLESIRTGSYANILRKKIEDLREVVSRTRSWSAMLHQR
jgi:hypothetical protein